MIQDRYVAPVDFDDECEQVARMATNAACKAGIGLPDGGRDEMLQVCRIGVWRAIGYYRSDAGLPWFAFAYFCARRELVTEVRRQLFAKNRTNRDALRFDGPPYADEPDLMLHDVVPDPGPSVEELAEQREDAWRILVCVAGAKLTDVEREVLMRVTLGGEPYGRVGRRKRIDNAKQRGLRKIRELAA
jgi:DNA-directed RNA polymerase specialized sigma24 family protein